jgi:hypothetical protein
MPSYRLSLPLALAPLLSVLSATPAAGQVNYIEMCNYGNTRMWVATVINRISGFAGDHSDTNVHEGRGWTAIDVRQGKEVFVEHTLQSVVAYFAVAYRDRSGVMGLYNFSPESGEEFSRSPAVFCAAEGTFSFRGPNLREPGQWCGQGAEADGSWWEPVPFILKWSKPVSWPVQSRNQTYEFTVRPNADAPVWRPLTLAPRANRSGGTSAPPASPPRRNRVPLVKLYDTFRGKAPSDSSKRFYVVSCPGEVTSAQIGALAPVVVTSGTFRAPVSFVASDSAEGSPIRNSVTGLIAPPNVFAALTNALWVNVNIVFEIPQSTSNLRFPQSPCPD